MIVMMTTVVAPRTSSYTLNYGLTTSTEDYIFVEYSECCGFGEKPKESNVFYGIFLK